MQPQCAHWLSDHGEKRREQIGLKHPWQYSVLSHMWRPDTWEKKGKYTTQMGASIFFLILRIFLLFIGVRTGTPERNPYSWGRVLLRLNHCNFVFIGSSWVGRSLCHCWYRVSFASVLVHRFSSIRLDKVHAGRRCFGDRMGGIDDHWYTSERIALVQERKSNHKHKRSDSQHH